jgi:hypothetical protein
LYRYSSGAGSHALINAGAFYLQSFYLQSAELFMLGATGNDSGISYRNKP